MLATAGTRGNYTASLTLNRQVSKFNFFGGADGSSNHFRGSPALQQAATANGRTTRTDQTGASTRRQASYGGRLGVDYALSEQQRLCLSVQFYKQDFQTTQDFTTLLTHDGDPTVNLQNQTAQVESLYNGRLTGNYRRTRAAHPGCELTASATYILDGGTGTTQQRVLDGPASYARQARQQLLDVTIHMPLAQVDYVHPPRRQAPLGREHENRPAVTPGSEEAAVQPALGTEFVR